MKRKIFIPIFFTISILSISITASAYSLIGNKWSSSSVTYYYDNYNSSRGQSYITSGATAWNTTDASLSKSSSYNIYVSEVENPNVTWDGLTTYYASGGNFTSVTISLNKSQTTTWDDNGALKSVSVHEFGHSLGLNDNGTAKTIMNGYTWGTNSRYGDYGLTAPQTDDKNGINSLY